MSKEMKTFIVHEAIKYEVKAASADEATQIIVDAVDRDKYFHSCVDRHTFEIED